MNLEREIKINKILLILLITLSVGTIAIRSSYAMFSKKETFNNVLRIITGNELPDRSGTEDLIIKGVRDGNGLQGLDPETGALCTSNCKEYRYTGSSVKNYVKLTNLNPNDITKTQDELWRIIGIFTDEDNGEKYMRIVRNEALSESYLPENYVINGQTYLIKKSGLNAYWNYVEEQKGGTNNWPTSGLYNYLNSEKDEGSNKGYMSYLSVDTKLMLRDTKHFLGTNIWGASGDTTLTGYQHERDIKSCENNKGEATSWPTAGCNVWKGNDATWTGSISLMYPSDVGFAASSDYWSNTKLYKYGDSDVKASSWMMQTMADATVNASWLLSTSSNNVMYIAAYWSTSGYITNATVYYAGSSIRPVLNIKSEIKIKRGTTGTKENPYIFTN